MKKRIVVRAAVVTVVCLALFTVQACRKDGPQQDAFVQKWRTVADQSQGHSPRDEGVPEDLDERNLNLEEGYEDVNDLLENMEVERPLPRIPISLEMRNANITAVLSALAKAASISMAISPLVGNPGGDAGDVGSPEVTINVFKKPWDEVFKGLIKNRGLVYNWENGILSVKTTKDAERDIKATALRARLMVQKLLLKRAEPPVTRVIKIRYSLAAEMQAIIQSIVFHQDASLTETEEDIGVIGAQGGMEGQSVLEERDASIQSKSEAAKPGESLSIPGYVTSDPETNTLIVQAPRPIMKVIYYLVRKIDRPRQQIKIKAYIVETDSNTARELGVRWGGDYQFTHAQGENKFAFVPGGGGGNVATYYTPVPGLAGGGAGPRSGRYTQDYGPGISGQGWAGNFPLTLAEAATSGASLGFLFGTIGGNILEAQLQALALEEKLKIISSPTLSTQDNKEALLKDGMEVPYRSGFDAQGNAIVSWKEAVLALRIKPHIINENALHMRIQIKKDELDFTLTTLDGIPVVRKKLAETELVTRNGETIVIGGLTKRTMTDNETGVPFLKDIPLLGYVFKQDLKQDVQQEVLIFITPQILDFWSPDDIQKSFDQIDRELREDGVVIDTERGFIQDQ